MIKRPLNGNWVNPLNNFIIDEKFLFIYPALLIAGITLRAITPLSVLDWIETTSFVRLNALINESFAYKGNIVFSVLFFMLFIISLRESFKNQKVHNGDVSAVHVSLGKAKHFIAKYLLKLLLLFILFYVIDHIFVLTGGRCIVDQTVCNILAKSSHSFGQCLEYNGTWVNLKEGFCLVTPAQLSERIKTARVCAKYGDWHGGFDISGHYCFLTTISLILWYELKAFLCNHSFVKDPESQVTVESIPWRKFSSTNFVRWLVILVLLIWSYLLLITAVFYHTFLEKVLGLLFGYVGPLTIYHAIANIKPLRDILY